MKVRAAFGGGAVYASRVKRSTRVQSLDVDGSAVTDSVARKWVLGGRVQGVGFRPFVYRVAQRCGARGWVRNCAGEVEIVAQGQPDMLRRFRHALLTEAPPLARPRTPF